MADKRTTVRLEDDDYEAIKTIRSYWGIGDTGAVIRFALRVAAAEADRKKKTQK